MRPKNMRYYRGPRVQPVTNTSNTNDALHIQSILTDIVTLNGTGQTFLSNVPVLFSHVALPRRTSTQPWALLNSEIASYAFQAMSFCWAVYLFSNGHFSSTIQSQNLPFNVSLACDPSEVGRSLFAEFAPNAKVFSSGNYLLQHVRALGETSILHGYLINSYHFLNSEVTTIFLKQQLATITQLRLIRNLLVIVAIIMPDHDGRSVKSFIRGLLTAHWKVSSRYISYPEIGDSIIDSCRIIIAIHSSSAPVVEPIVLKIPPAVQPRSIASYLWEPFNRPEHSLCFGRDDSNFNKAEASRMTGSTPKPAKSGSTTPITILYYLHRADADATIVAGSSVLSQLNLCPPFKACPTRNLFQHFFGIEFHFNNSHTYVHAILTFEFACCFNLIENIQYRISHEKY